MECAGFAFISIRFHCCLFCFEISFISFPQFVINQYLNFNSNSILLCIMFCCNDGHQWLKSFHISKHKRYNISALSRTHTIWLNFQRDLYFCQTIWTFLNVQTLQIHQFIQNIEILQRKFMVNANKLDVVIKMGTIFSIFPVLMRFFTTNKICQAPLHYFHRKPITCVVMWLDFWFFVVSVLAFLSLDMLIQ